MGRFTEEMVKQALSTVVDPELGMNIIDLGLVYDFDFDDEDNVSVEMTLTSAGCPLGDVLSSMVEHALRRVGAQVVDVEIVWNPAWSPEMMSEEARAKLGWGIR